jgi:hypothetical protein
MITCRCVSRAHHGHAYVYKRSALCSAVCHQWQVLKYAVILFQGTLFPDRVKKPAKKAIQPFLTELEQHWRESA